jgi:hypothetical protein
MDLGTVPQWVTAIIAVAAGIIAIVSIRIQRDVARKRAALDLFLKTSTDSAVVSMVSAYVEAFKKIRDPKRPPGPMVIEPEDQSAIISYLNILELIAVGVHNGVLDERVCFEFWSDQVVARYSEARPVIEELRKTVASRFVFIDLEELSKRWELMKTNMAEGNLRYPKLKKF